MCIFFVLTRSLARGVGYILEEMFPIEVCVNYFGEADVRIS